MKTRFACHALHVAPEFESTSQWIGTRVAPKVDMKLASSTLSFFGHVRSGALWLAVTVSATSVAGGCASEPCSYSKDVSATVESTPFSDGSPVFSKCAACPELPKMPGVDASGAATVCRVSFHDNEPAYAWVDCFYGPGGNTSSSIANGAVTDVPNLFDYCESHCPDEDALHACSFRADSQGVESFSCHYGQTCG